MKKIAVFAFFVLAGIPAQSGQIINLPCTSGWKNPDSMMSLVDGEHFITYGGRNGEALDHKYSKFLGFEQKMSYQAPNWRYPQDYGICKLILR